MYAADTNCHVSHGEISGDDAVGHGCNARASLSESTATCRSVHSAVCAYFDPLGQIVDKTGLVNAAGSVMAFNLRFAGNTPT